MLTSIITPWYRRAQTRAGGSGDRAGSVDPTPILDYTTDVLQDLVGRARAESGGADSLAMVQAAHALIRDEVRAVYGMEEATPASETLMQGSGSCSQRLAILESVARAVGIQTRVRALLVDRSFWAPRFPRFTFVLPPHIVIAWPEFLLEDWRSASELFGPVGCQTGPAFTNSGSETLFEAVGRCAVDWDGLTGGGESDLSRFVRADLGYFTNRDELFARVGQTLCAPSRKLVDPVMRRIAA